MARTKTQADPERYLSRLWFVDFAADEYWRITASHSTAWVMGGFYAKGLSKICGFNRQQATQEEHSVLHTLFGTGTSESRGTAQSGLAPGNPGPIPPLAKVCPPMLTE